MGGDGIRGRHRIEKQSEEPSDRARPKDAVVLSSREPALRVAIVKEHLGAARELGSHYVAAIEEDLGQSWMADIDAMVRTQWVRQSLLVDVLAAVQTRRGKAGVIKVARTVAKNSSGSPLFIPIIRGALSVFGKGAMPLVRALPRAFALSNRSSGRLSVEVDSKNGMAIVTLENLHPDLRHPAYGLSWCGTLAGIGDLAGITAATDVNLTRLEEGWLEAELCWSQEKG